jgi:colicin import membrane protein
MARKEDLKREQRRFAAWLGIATAAHVAVVAVAILLQLYHLRNRPPVKIVSVSLVTLPGPPGPVGGGPGMVPASEAAPEVPAPSPAPKTSEPFAPPAPKQAPVPVAAKKTVPAEDASAAKRRLDDALSKLKQSSDSRQQSRGQQQNQGMSTALSTLQKKVASQGSGPAHGSGSGGGGGLYGPGGGASDPYKSKIAGIINDNWQFSNLLLRNAKGMEVYVAINILPDGTIAQIRYDRKAPSEYLNNTVKVALQKSKLPPIPREYGARPIWVGFVFGPEGVQQ